MNHDGIIILKSLPRTCFLQYCWLHVANYIANYIATPDIKYYKVLMSKVTMQLSYQNLTSVSQNHSWEYVKVLHRREETLFKLNPLSN